MQIYEFYAILQGSIRQSITEVSQKCLITVLSEIGFPQVQLNSGVRHNTSRDHDAPPSRSGTSVDLLAHVQSRAQHFSTRKIHPSI
jgi:hypothetical protein